MAAEREGREVDDSQMLDGIDAWQHVQWLVIEGAGGAMSPISTNWLNVDYARRLKPHRTFLVAANRLGVQHDVLATITAMHTNGLSVDAVILSEVQLHVDDSVEGNRSELSRYLPDVSFIDFPHGEARLSEPTKVMVDQVIGR